MLNKRVNAPGLSDENFSYASRGKMMPFLVMLKNLLTTLSLSLPPSFPSNFLFPPSPGCCSYQRTYNYQEVSRTLCPTEPTPETRPSDQIIFVDVASMAPFNIAYELLVTRLENFQLE